MNDERRLVCLNCDQLLGHGEPVCSSCGGVPFSRSESGQHSVVVGPIASLAFRRQTAEVLATHINGLVAEDLNAALHKRVVIARGVDADVGRALLERLRRVPAEAELLRSKDEAPGFARRLLGPMPMLLYASGLVAAIVPGVPILAAFVAAVLATTVALVYRPSLPAALSEPPVLPAAPNGIRALFAVSEQLQGEDKIQTLDIAKNSVALLAAAQREGLDVSTAEFDGMDRAVADVVEEASQVGQRLVAGDNQARERLQEIAATVRSAAQRAEVKALPAAAEQRLLQQAEVVKEIAEIKASN